MSDNATIGMRKSGDTVTYEMRSPHVTITLVAKASATPEHINDMVDEFPDAVYAVTRKAMGNDADS